MCLGGGRQPEEDPEGERREQRDTNLADCLLLLLHVFAERYHTGVGEVTKEQCLQNEVRSTRLDQARRWPSSRQIAPVDVAHSAKAH